MPTYAYKCDKCKHAFEEFRSILKPHPKKCPNCGEKGEAFHQDYPVSTGAATIMYGSPTTIGQQAEINAKKVGKELTEKILAEKTGQRFDGKLPDGAEVAELPQAATPFWRDGSVEGTKKLDKPLDVTKLATKEAKRRYILDGK